MNEIYNGAGREQPWRGSKFCKAFQILRICESNVNWTGCCFHLIHSRGAEWYIVNKEGYSLTMSPFKIIK